jgi:glycosyltransferase involved in cell wall biosynthesis
MGGPTYNATFLTRFLSDDFETLLVGGLPDEGETDSLHILEEYGVEPLLIPEMKRLPSFQSDRKAYARIKEIIKEYQPDIVHTHASKAGALGRKAAIEMKVPVVVHTFHGHVFHSYFGKFKTLLYKTIERRLAKKSSGIIAISDLQKKELAVEHKICTDKMITVIPLGFDLNKFHDDLEFKRSRTREQFDLDEETVAVAIVGRLAPIKNHGLFLDIVEQVAASAKKKVRFFIVGDGSERLKIEGRINAMVLPENISIHMTSWIKDIGTFNAGMDIMCLTSDNEGTPVSLIEAQASNIPVISTDVGGVKDIVDLDNTGFVVPKGSVGQFAEKLLLLIEDEKKREKMSQNGWIFVEHKFHYTTLVRNMESYYHKLLNETLNDAKK